LFEEQDAVGLAEAVQRLLSDRPKMNEMGLCARQFVVSKFDIRVQTPLLEDLYDEVIGSTAH
jgi:glycosyltransferase involved in cell wall biosynthesis